MTNLKMKSVIHCTSADKIPKGRHWAIIRTASGTEPAYDRNTPASSFNYVLYDAYLDMAEWTDAVTELTTAKRTGYTSDSFQAMEVNPAVISTKVEVTINT